MKRHFILFIFALSSITLTAQDYDIGVRAGINLSQFVGPSEEGVNEYFGISSGFHFGINFQWNFNSVIGVRGELMYTQMGSQYTYDDDGFYVFDFLETGTTAERFVVRDKSFQELTISNAHFMIPVTAHVTLSEKFEIFGGAYFSTLVSPVGIGEWTFGRPDDRDVPHNFKQTLDYRYNSDQAGILGRVLTATGQEFSPVQIGYNQIGRPIKIIAGGQDVDLPSIPGAYLLLEQDKVYMLSGTELTVDRDFYQPDVKRFKGIDYGFIGGFAYYLNRGLYLSARLEYGMVDITNTEVDYSLSRVEDDGTLIFNDDFDRNMNIALSLGFRF